VFRSRDFRNILQRFVVGVSILAVASLAAAGQTLAENVQQPSLIEGSEARDQLNEGVKAYKAAHYDEAVARFQKAAELDPGLLMAKKYLGVAVAQTVIPGLDTPENLMAAQRAIDALQQVLAEDSHDVNAMKQIAGIFFSVKNLDDAKAWQKKVLDVDPKDPEAAYTIGVIDWTMAHQNALKALIQAGIQDDGEGNIKAPAEALEVIRVQNAALVEEALEYLHQAVENRPDYGNAMAYLNLVYRRKADVDWGNEAARKDDVAQAMAWMRKSMAAHKANEEKQNPKPGSAQP
jgi:tetratricopeptide (TPR) repeat protein